MSKQKMRHVVSTSGGIGSWMAAYKVLEKYPKETVTLLFTDTKMEDTDLYRFLDESEEYFGLPITRIADGRTPWEVFNDVRFLGNSRIDPCSKILKRELTRTWLETNCDPANTIMYLGIDWTEIHRLDRAKPLWASKGWAVEAPLCEKPYMDKDEIKAFIQSQGIELPRLYKLGFPHNNCGGFCIKAGQSQFKHLLLTLPEVYKYHEEQEQAIREKLGDVSILRRQVDWSKQRLTLKQFREEIEAKASEVPEDEWGGCNCFSPEEIFDENEKVG